MEPEAELHIVLGEDERLRIRARGRVSGAEAHQHVEVGHARTFALWGVVLEVCEDVAVAAVGIADRRAPDMFPPRRRAGHGFETLWCAQAEQAEGVPRVDVVRIVEAQPILLARRRFHRRQDLQS